MRMPRPERADNVFPLRRSLASHATYCKLKKPAAAPTRSPHKNTASSPKGGHRREFKLYPLAQAEGERGPRARGEVGIAPAGHTPKPR